MTRLVDDDTTIAITDMTINISPGNDHTMTGLILSRTCDWLVPFKEGRTEYRTLFKAEDITITLEAKDGKVFFLVAFKNDPDKRIRVWADGFSETK